MESSSTNNSHQTVLNTANSQMNTNPDSALSPQNAFNGQNPTQFYP